VLAATARTMLPGTNASPPPPLPKTLMASFKPFFQRIGAFVFAVPYHTPSSRQLRMSCNAIHSGRCLVVRLSDAYSRQKFLFLGGFLAPWSMAGTFGIAADAIETRDTFLLVLTAPLLEWKTSQPTKTAAAADAAAIARSNATAADE
jgi:hypothetical protein